MKNILRNYKIYIKNVLTKSKTYINNNLIKSKTHIKNNLVKIKLHTKDILIRNKTHVKNVLVKIKIHTKTVLTRSKVHIKDILISHKINMKSVFKIYKRDIKSIVTSYATLIMIVVMILLPALYSWFNIGAGWDPYSNTKGLLVAVVNQDKGSEIRNVKVNVGNDVIKKLKTNQSIGWTFVNAVDAKDGIKYGRYYASLTIPKDFSKDLLSVATSDDPTKAKLIYTVNEKRNAVAPKLTGKGATTLQEEITRSFIETASGTIFSYLNQIGVELQENKSQLKSIVNTVIDLDNKMPEIKKSLDIVYGESVMFKDNMLDVQGNVPAISTSLANTLGLIKTSNGYISKSKDSLKFISPVVKNDLSQIKDKADTAESSLTKAQALLPSNSALLKDTLVNTREQYRDGIQKIDNVLSLNKSINSYLDNYTIDTFINNLTNVKNEMENQENDVNSMINTLELGDKVTNNDLTAAVQGANKASTLMNNLTGTFDTTISPTIDKSTKNINELSTNTINKLQNLQKDMPSINSTLTETNSEINGGVKHLKDIKDKFPKAQQDLHSNVAKLKGFTDDKKLNELIVMLKKDGQKESDFLSSPIDLIQNRVYPIPNYGSAMAPFYTTLAIWVGSLTLLSMLSVHVKDFKDGQRINTREKYLGRYFTFMSIAIMQALVTIAGNLFLLKTYAASPIILTLFGLYVSIIFMTFMYTAVSVLGNIGKSLLVVVMVLQISASGGTFPIELLGSFFQYINPMMPFTYAIGGMREAIGGIIPSVLINDMLVLSIYAIVSLFLGLFLKEKINKIAAGFIKQFKDSGLAE